jgi:hypothetical protein
MVRSLINYGKERKTSSDLNKTAKKNKVSPKKVSKDIGEYIDYEEIKK